MNIFISKNDGTEDDGTLFSLSSEFLEAANVLQGTPPTNLSYSLVIYYLLGHSAELMLKAFLYKKKVSTSELRKVGHDLNQLISMSKNHELTGSVELSLTKELASIYKDKRLEYRKRKDEDFPDRELLYRELKTLQNVVFNSLY